MLEQVYPRIFKNEIPLPKNPLKALNSYILLGEPRPLIIDTGFNVPEAEEAFYQGLAELNVDPAGADVIITHLHADHSGLAYKLQHQGARIWMSEGDGSTVMRMRDSGGWEKTRDRMILFGLPFEEDLVRKHPGRAYAPEGPFPYSILKEGDTVSVGDYHLQVISVPGHTPDMINLYEPTHKLYFSGDHVLDPITPNIAFWGFEHPAILNQYFQSLKKIYDLPIDRMLTAHRALLTDPKRRIDELLDHHRQRLMEVETILNDYQRPATVTDVARKMTWRIRHRDWDDFPVSQKTFAVGEAMSHLDYLVFRGRVAMEERQGVLYFTRTEKSWQEELVLADI